MKLTDKPVIAFLAAVVGAFAAGATALVFLNKQVDLRVDERIGNNPAIEENTTEVLAVIRQAKDDALASLRDVPVGTILSFYGTREQRPDGFLFCDGEQYPNSDYEKLSRHLIATNPDLKINARIFKTPDLRGIFLRGLDTRPYPKNDKSSDEGRDPEGSKRTIGDPQNDALRFHNHDIQLFESDGNRSKFNVAYINKLDSAGKHMVLSLSSEKHRIVGGTVWEPDRIDEFETRPKNVAVNFIIRY